MITDYVFQMCKKHQCKVINIDIDLILSCMQANSPASVFLKKGSLWNSFKSNRLTWTANNVCNFEIHTKIVNEKSEFNFPEVELLNILQVQKGKKIIKNV